MKTPRSEPLHRGRHRRWGVPGESWQRGGQLGISPAPLEVSERRRENNPNTNGTEESVRIISDISLFQGLYNQKFVLVIYRGPLVLLTEW